MNSSTLMLGGASAVNIGYLYEMYKLWVRDGKTKEIIKKQLKIAISISLVITALFLCYIFPVITKAINYNSVYTDARTAKIGHLWGDTITYVFNTKHEINASDYGIDVNRYSDGDKFYVYIEDSDDYNSDVIRVLPKNEIDKTEESLWVNIIASMIAFVVVFVVWTMIARQYVFPVWHSFCIWLRIFDEDELKARQGSFFVTYSNGLYVPNYIVFPLNCALSKRRRRLYNKEIARWKAKMQNS